MIYLPPLTIMPHPSEASTDINTQTDVSITQFLLTINLKAYTALANAGVKNQHKFNFKTIKKCKGLVNCFVFMVIMSLTLTWLNKRFWEIFLIKELHFTYKNYQLHAFSN